jgi:hypothetical protein
MKMKMKTHSWIGDWRYGGLELFRSLELEDWPGRAGSWMHRCKAWSLEMDTTDRLEAL